MNIELIDLIQTSESNEAFLVGGRYCGVSIPNIDNINRFVMLRDHLITNQTTDIVPVSVYLRKSNYLFGFSHNAWMPKGLA